MKKTHIKTIIFFFFLLSLVHVTNKNAFARAFSLEADTGLGYDSNAFRSPDTSYFDPFSKTTLIPKVQSGWFVPYKLLGAHFIKPRKKTWLRKLKITRWSSKFVLSGRKYIDSALDNADSRRFSGKTGVLFLLKKAGKRKNTFYIGPVVKQKKVTYYDRDTGVEKRTNAGLPLGDRYSYHFYGLDIKLKIRTTPVKFAVNAKVREYDYKATAFDQFDHTYYQIGGEASYKIITKTKLTGGYAFTVRDYDAWVARDLNGKKTPTLNPMRKYTFGDMDISLRHKLTRRLDNS
ncbi:MAG: hypothetical protein ACE5FU_11210, partial [Nitrospinota bacterium]